MMNALIAATLCSIVLSCGIVLSYAPAMKAAYVRVRRDDRGFRRRR
jgi:hypothetical protein